MKYRQEIDGLRAIAVLAVIFYHAGFGVAKGGFLGVDIFFVISGFLISSLLMASLEERSFSMARFYERRARRILPALCVVVAASVPAAYIIMLPSQLNDFSASVLAVLAFVANIFFWQKTGYFAPESNEMPLLHTWSLGVEEQFYILFPMILWLLWRYARRYILPSLLLFFAISFALCEVGSRVAPNANFYLLPTRTWELLAGACCACVCLKRKIIASHALSLLGLALLLFSILWFDDRMSMPSALTLLPIIGVSIIVVFATSESIGGQILSLRPLVGIGRISYSAYLWHHPLFAFVRIMSPVQPSSVVMGALICVSLFLGWVSWYWIEQPLRVATHPRYVRTPHALCLLAVFLVLLLGASGAGLMTQGNLNGWLRHAPEPQARAYQLIEEARNRANHYDDGQCVFDVREFGEALEQRLGKCFATYGAGIAVIGDSHGINLFGELRHIYRGKFLVSFAQGMCRPHSPRAFCYYDAFLAFTKSHPNYFFKIIYEQAGWHLLMTPAGNEINENDLYGLSVDAVVPDYVPNHAYIEAVKTYLAALSVYSKVTWLGPHIEPQIREEVAVRMGCNHVFSLRPNQTALFERIDRDIQTALADSSVSYLSQMQDIEFDMQRDFMNCDTVYFYDTNHYSAAGEKRFGEQLKNILYLR